MSQISTKKLMSQSLFVRFLVLTLVTICVIISDHQLEALDNGLALTPPMGWLSWERFTCVTDCQTYPNDCINSRLYMSMADRLVSDGYAELGYEYVNIDDCWSEKQRDLSKPGGPLVEDRQRFPEGLGALAKYMHSKRLKLGIYGDCGTATCAGYPAQLKTQTNLEDNNFEVDANTFAQWEIDSFKFDGCNLDPAKAESICPKMALALNATKRPIAVICEWPLYMLGEMFNLSNTKLKPNFDLAAKACNAWRYYSDVEDSWLSILSIIDFSIKIQSTIVKYHGPGHWFDPDQLVIGNFALSLDQARAQMALWSIWSAPLYMSNDLRAIEPEMATVLKNRHLIAVNQDQMGIFGLMVAQSNDGHHQAFAKPVEPIRAGCPSFVVVYLNRDTLGNSRDISFKTRDLLVNLPISLAAERYNNLYPRQNNASSSSSETVRQRPGGVFEADRCKQLLERAMTRKPGESAKVLLNQPLNQPVKSVDIEDRPVRFTMIDLFGDEQVNRTITLDGELELRVNPSGVRAVKLVRSLD